MKHLLVVILVGGCALTGKAKPLDIAYYQIELAARARHAATSPPRLLLRLDDVTAATHLGSRIVRKVSGVEVEPYEARRWTEYPDVFVRRALVRQLFEDLGIQQSVDYRAPTLEVTVTDFSEVAYGHHVGRVELRYLLRDRQRVFAQGSVAAVREVRGTTFAAVVTAIGGALDEAAERLAGEVARALAAHSEAVAALDVRRRYVSTISQPPPGWRHAVP